MKQKLLIFFLLSFSQSSFADFSHIPNDFYDTVGGKFLPGEKKLIIWMSDYCGYALTLDGNTYTEYFMYCDTLQRAIHTAVVRQYFYKDKSVKILKNTIWTHDMDSKLFRALADSIDVFFHYATSEYTGIDTIYKQMCCFNWPPKTIWLYNKNDEIMMHIEDDQMGFMNNDCLAFILLHLYLYYDYDAYWETIHAETWGKPDSRRYRKSQKLQHWFSRKSTGTISYKY